MTSPRVTLIHWHAGEAQALAGRLTTAGYHVQVAQPRGPTGLQALAADPPDVFVIDLARLPSDGQAVGIDLKRRLGPAARAVTAGVGMWVAWPKKTSSLAKDLTEREVRALGLATGLVDYKICAIDSDWSGLKFTQRRVGAAKR